MPEVMYKICRKCGKKKPKTTKSFYRNRANKDGLTNNCKECMKEYNKEYRQTPEGRENQRRHVRKCSRRVMLKSKFGLTLEQYNIMFIKQKGCCAICGRHQSEFKKCLAVDHNHETEQIRGLLCVVCNTRLSFFEDKVFLKKMVAYLAKYATADPEKENV